MAREDEQVGGVLINPAVKMVSEVFITKEEVPGLIGTGNLTAHPVSEEDHIVLDAAGITKEGQLFWSFHGRTYAGAALILGTGPEGNSLEDATLTPIEVKAAVEWLSVRYVGTETIDCGVVETPHGMANQYWVIPRYEPVDAPPAPPEPAPEPVEAPEVVFWTIYQLPDQPYQAVLSVAHQGNGKVVEKTVLEHEDLGELRSMLSPNRTLLPRTDRDAPEIVEAWLVK